MVACPSCLDECACLCPEALWQVFKNAVIELLTNNKANKWKSNA